MSVNFKGSFWGRVLRDSIVLVGVVFATLLVYRMKFGDFVSFLSSPFLLVALVGGLVSAFIMENGDYPERKSSYLRERDRRRIALVAVVTVFTLVIDVYTFISASFTIGASLISVLAFATCGLSFIHFFPYQSCAAASLRHQSRNQLPGVVHFTCLLCIFTGLILVHFA